MPSFDDLHSALWLAETIVADIKEKSLQSELTVPAYINEMLTLHGTSLQKCSSITVLLSPFDSTACDVRP